MGKGPTIRLGTIIDQFHLEVLYGPEGYRDRQISIQDVNRPGLQMTGYFDYFDRERMQLLGLVEWSYLQERTAEERMERFDQLFSYHTPAVIIARGLEPYPECMGSAKKYDQVLLRTKENTADFMSTLIAYLRVALSPTITRHGVLVEVYGEGVLLMGESGVGKSETAIELIKRGHRLIADDAVEIRRGFNNRLVGTAPELIRHYMELRGTGVIGVTWKNNASNASSTSIERCPSGGSWAVVSSPGSVVTSYSDSVGTGTYKYRVRYRNGDGWSGYSNESEWVTALCAPAAPTCGWRPPPP